MDDLNLVATVADKIGVIFLFVLAGFMLYKRKLVFGWVHDDCEKNLDKCQAIAEARAVKIEADLEKLRADREGRTSSA